jgi:hypothetical protein
MPVPDFSPGEVLTAAAMDSIGLWLVKTQTVGAGVASVPVTDAFSADYDAYKIIYSSGVGSSTNAQVNLTLGSTVTGYKWGYGIFLNGSATGVASTAGTFVTVGEINADVVQMNIDIINPFLTKHTYFGGTLGFNNANGNGRAALSGLLQNTTSYTAFTLTPSNGTLTGGTIRVYGYRN